MIAATEGTGMQPSPTGDEAPTVDPWIVQVRLVDPHSTAIHAVELIAGMRGERTARGVRFAFYDDEQAAALARKLTRAGYFVIYGPEQSLTLAAEYDRGAAQPPAAAQLVPISELEVGEYFYLLSGGQRFSGPWRKVTAKSYTAEGIGGYRQSFKKALPQGVKTLVERAPAPVVAKAREDFAVVERDPDVVAAGRAVGDLHTPRAMFDYLAPILAKYSQETFVVVPLDLRGVPLNDKPYIVAMGQHDQVSVDVGDAIRPAIDTNAHGVVFAHNHPSGKAKPSRADRDLTERLRKALAAGAPSCVFLDHLVIGGASREYYSFAEEKITHV